MVARLDEQKRQLDLIEAFGRADHGLWKVAIVGGADYSSEYARAVTAAARRTDGVILLGHQNREALDELYSHAAVFVLPSSHEGQPIAALEAMSYGCPVILSDIPAHRELGNPKALFFPPGDTAALIDCLEEFFRNPTARQLDAGELEPFMQAHDWRQVAHETLEVYMTSRRGAARAVQLDMSGETPTP
jgi:glycosyltransferase involved in cell wall biosynthesis